MPFIQTELVAAASIRLVCAHKQGLYTVYLLLLTALATTAFAVHAQDTLNPQVFNDNAPSRPPSRVSMKGRYGLNDGPNGFDEHNTSSCCCC